MRSTALLAALCGLLLTACGGSDDPASDGAPATIAPADAQAYVEAVVRPEGSQREDALAAIGKVTDSDDPAAEVRELVAMAEKETEIDYARDIGPWLGERVGVWVDEIAPEQAAFGVVMQADDPAEGVAALKRSAEEAGEDLREGSHGGAEYLVGSGSDDEYTFGAIGDFVVLASREQDFKRTVDAEKGKNLGESERFEEAMGELPEEALVSFYLEPAALEPLFTAEMGGQEAQIFKSLYDLQGSEPATGAMTADGERITFDGFGSTAASKVPGLAGLGGSTELVQEVPGDAWGAGGVPDLGKTAKGLVDTFAGALGSGILQGQLESQTGINLERDVFSWLGDVAFFVSGEGLDGIRGGAVIETTDPDKAADAFGRLIGVLRTQASGPTKIDAVELDGADTAFAISEDGMPEPVIAALGEERLVVTYGEDAARAALGDGDQLGDSELWSQATGVLEDDDLSPSFVLDFRRVLALAEEAGAEDPDFAKARPYLDALTVLVSGTETDDEETHSRLSVGLGE